MQLKSQRSNEFVADSQGEISLFTNNFPLPSSILFFIGRKIEFSDNEMSFAERNYVEYESSFQSNLWIRENEVFLC